MRHLNVVVVSWVNELSLLSGLLRAALFLAALFRGLLLSCHIVVLLLSFQVVTTRYCVSVCLVVKTKQRTTCCYINFIRNLVNNLLRAM